MKVHIPGAGGVGFWLAVALVRSNVQPLVVYDTDDLQGGRGHTRLPLARPTTTKLDLLRGFIRVNIGGVMPELVPALFTGAEAGPGDLVVDCTDMSGGRRAGVWRVAREQGARCLRVSYDGANSTVVVAEGLPLTGDESAAGYANVPSFALSLAAGGIGAEVVQRLFAEPDTEHIEFQISLAELIQPREYVGLAHIGPDLPVIFADKA